MIIILKQKIMFWIWFESLKSSLNQDNIKTLKSKQEQQEL